MQHHHSLLRAAWSVVRLVVWEGLNFITINAQYQNLLPWVSLAKKGPVSNIYSPPIIASISCKGLKFTPKSAHPIDLVQKVFKCNMMQG